MLLFSTNSITVDGVTVFPDHADKNQFWYLPGPVDLAKMPGSDEPQFLLIEYTPEVAATGVKGVGFLNVTVCLKLRDDTRGRIMGQIQQFFPDADDPRIEPVPFDEGTVQIVALDMQGSGGAANTAAPGTFEAVEHILGAVAPELFGDNNAVFGLTLSEDGASILKAAFEGGMAPVGAIYTLKFTGVRPALDVKVTADLKRVYDSFSIGVSAKAYWVTLGIDATFEKLRQDGAIKIEVVDLAGDQTNADKEKEALDLFKNQNSVELVYADAEVRRRPRRPMQAPRRSPHRRRPRQRVAAGRRPRQPRARPAPRPVRRSGRDDGAGHQRRHDASGDKNRDNVTGAERCRRHPACGARRRHRVCSCPGGFDRLTCRAWQREPAGCRTTRRRPVLRRSTILNHHDDQQRGRRRAADRGHRQVTRRRGEGRGQPVRAWDSIQIEPSGRTQDRHLRI